MSMRVPVTEPALRRAMRDERYWRPGHPEREGFVGWVTDGYRQLASGTSGMVFVRAYTRSRNGRTEHVAAHARSARPRAGERASEPRVIQAQAPLLLTPRLPLYARPPTGPLPPGTPMQRIPRQSGREAAKDVPGWARGLPRHVGETPTQYAERLLDQRYGGRQNWDTGRQSRGSDSEFSQIQKHGARAYRDPRGLIAPHVEY